MFTKRTRFILLSSILIALMVGGFWFRQKSSAKSSQIIYVHPEIRTITNTLELSGLVKAKKQANLHFQTGGLVTYYPWQEGDSIKKYQTIAALDQRQLQKYLKQQLNLYAKQRNAFDQLRDDHQKNIDDGDIDLRLKRILENSQYDLDNAVINVELKDLALQYSYLIAPFNGILIKSPITTSHVNILPTDMFVLVDPNSLYFSAELEEGDLAKVNLDTPVSVSLDAFPNETFSGKIELISFSAKETSVGTVYPIEITFSDSDLSKFRLSLNGTAYLNLDKKENVLSIPQEAIHEDDRGNFVFVLDANGKQYRQSIKLGLEGTDYVEVISGLSPDDQIIIEEN